MGFGAIITTGEDFTPMDAGMMGFITECRVEQDLSKLTQFAIRFEDDICEGDPVVAGRPELAANQVISVFVKQDDDFHCLVSGRITQVRTSSMVGGAGSWVEIKGQDELMVMDRVGVQASWTGKASDAASSLFEAYGFSVRCQQTLKDYGEGNNALNQRGTDLAFVRDVARKNNMELWLSYETQPMGNLLSVERTANLYSSPEQPTAASMDALPPPAPPVLSPDPSLTLPIQPPAGTCARVTRFDVNVDYEKPNAASGFTQDAASGEDQEQTQTPDTAPLDTQAEDIVAVDGVERTALAPPVTDPQEHYLAQQAMLTEAAWFIEVDCSSTLELLTFPIMPHQIIDVSNAGAQLSGPYQVMSATHVINSADHFIDFKLRANGLRPAAGIAA